MTTCDFRQCFPFLFIYFSVANGGISQFTWEMENPILLQWYPLRHTLALVPSLFVAGGKASTLVVRLPSHAWGDKAGNEATHLLESRMNKCLDTNACVTETPYINVIIVTTRYQNYVKSPLFNYVIHQLLKNDSIPESWSFGLNQSHS